MGSGWAKPQDAKKSPYKAVNAFNQASFIVGAEAGDTINVAVQLKDARGAAIAQRAVAKAYLSGSSAGAGLTATVPTSTLAIGTNGTILNVLTTNKSVDVITDASGRFDLNVIQTAAPVTYYLVVVMPDGSVSISGAITFA